MVENKKLRAAKTQLGWLIDPASVKKAAQEQGKEAGE